jgi:hypothetical protein
MSAVRSLGGTVGVLLGAVLLLLGLLLSPVLLPLAALVFLFVGGWKFWRLKHRVERSTKRGRRRVDKAGSSAKRGGQRVGKAGKKAAKRAEKALPL